MKNTVYDDVYCLFGFRLGQGREKALQYLRENPSAHEEIEKTVRSVMVEELAGNSVSHFMRSSPRSLETDEEYPEEIQ